MAKGVYSGEFKAKVVMEILREERSINEIAADYQLHPNQLRNWKKQFVEGAAKVFDERKEQYKIAKQEKELQAKQARMLKTIGQLTLERDFLRGCAEEIFGPDYEKKIGKPQL